jgi:cyclase
MLRTRVIPSLLLSDGRLVKTTRFAKPRYVGDPINAIRIFNDKEVDELAILDIEASARGTIDFELLGRMSREAFMPLAYGGGIREPGDIDRIFSLGYEKVIINKAAIDDISLISKAAERCGSQSVVACIDVLRSPLGGRFVYDHLRGRRLHIGPGDRAAALQSAGAGEILLYSVDRDGTRSGYDLELIREVAARVTIPVIALGGAGRIEDFGLAIENHAAAVAAGSFFVFHGPHQAVLITYPPKEKLKMIRNGELV